jgi:hypothetical protein
MKERFRISVSKIVPGNEAEIGFVPGIKKTERDGISKIGTFCWHGIGVHFGGGG